MRNPSDGDPTAGGLLSPLRTPAAGELLADRIMTAIALGEFTPGQRLPAERELAAQLGVSRTTVRDALARVVTTGLLEVRRGRSGGAFVRRPGSGRSSQSPPVRRPAPGAVLSCPTRPTVRGRPRTISQATGYRSLSQLMQ